MRLIDADAFADFIKNTIKVQKYDALKVNGDTLTVEDVLESIIAELDGTSLDGFKNNPTIEPKRMKGRWVRKNDGVYCSACYKGWDFMTGVPAEVETEYKFCPNCGADMRGSENG